ncbi:hypothetical protein [Dactylosporangium maewongense]
MSVTDHAARRCAPANGWTVIVTAHRSVLVALADRVVPVGRMAVPA